MITIPGVSPFWTWVLFILGIIVLLIFDLVILNRKDHVVGVKESLSWVVVWVLLAMGFCGWIYAQFGSEKALEFLTGYLIEESLSVDNLFVFLMIFSAFNIPRIYQHRILFWGILGAIVMRGLFIGLGAALVSRFEWVFLIFGLILLYGAYHMQFQKEKRFDPEKNLAVRITRKIFPVSKRLHGHDFFVREKGRWSATVLFVALMSIELSDVVFATDSIPAIFAITTDPFIVFTSNIFAILGLRALYFSIAGLHSMFAYLKTGLAVILAFIGVKMLLFRWVHLEVVWSLVFIAAVLLVSILSSMFFAKGGKYSDELIETEENRVRVRIARRDVRQVHKRH